MQGGLANFAGLYYIFISRIRKKKGKVVPSLMNASYKKHMKELPELREEIDRIDDQIAALYEERMQIAGEVAEYKIKNGKKVFDREREQSKLQSLSQKAKSEFTRLGLLELFKQIIAMSRKKQYQLLCENGIVEKPDFQEEDIFDTSGKRIVFQGVEGAYSQQALKEFFGEDCDSYHVETWKDAMEEIKSGKADFAVLPIENSSAGVISENYDLLAAYDHYIVGEQILKVNHALLGLPDARLEQIRCVYSHPQALMQCGAYLEEHRDWKRISLKNTAVAAKKIREEGDVSQAAIASGITADIYGLKVLAGAIQNNQNNSTRFIIVTGKRVYSPKAEKISICFELPHKSGSLHRALSHFIYNNLNMTNIQSRTIPGKNWEYRFFIDFEGTFSSTSVQNALMGLREETESLRILGTY